MSKLTFADYLAKHIRIGEMRTRMQTTLARDAKALSDAALAQVVDWLDRNPSASLDEVTRVLSDRVSLPVAQSRTLQLHLSEAQSRILTLRTQLIEEAGVSLSGALRTERLSALYRVDFPKIESTTNKLLQLVLRQAAVSDLPTAPTIYSALRQTGNVRHVASTLANTALAQFDGAYTAELARSSGIDTFEYAGPPAQRIFCSNHLGQQYTRAEIEQMDNGQGLPVMTSCGGYNCRHSWLPVPAFMIAQK